MPIIKTPIGTIDPATIEKLRSSIDPNYGNAMFEQGCEKLLVICAPVSDPDPVNDLEKGVAQLDNFDIKVDKIVLMGTDHSISIDGTTAAIVLERMKRNPLRNKYRIARSERPAGTSDSSGPSLQKSTALQADEDLIRQNIQDAAGSRSEWHYAPAGSVPPRFEKAAAQESSEMPDDALENALREKGYMIFEISLGQNGPVTRSFEGMKTGVIASRKGKYPEKILLRFYDSCSMYDVEKASTIADALDVNFCLMVYENLERSAKASALGRKVELVSRKELGGFLEMI